MEVPKKITEYELQQLVVSALAEQREITAIEKYAQQHENHQLPLQQKYYQDLDAAVSTKTRVSSTPLR